MTTVQEMEPSQRKLAVASMSDEEVHALAYDWLFWARPEQITPPGDWYIWLILAGRGFGKTRSGAEQVRIWVKDFPIVNLIGATADDARDIMIEGESGIMNICPPHEKPQYKKYERKLMWPNGALSLIFTADQPERLRGKQHMKLWADEICSWRYVSEAWDQAMFGLRLGMDPQAIVTTTPKPIKQLIEMVEDPLTHITAGTTYDNRANLAAGFFNKIIKKYEGTRLGQQELLAKILTDVPGALWKRSKIEDLRVRTAGPMMRVVVAIDPPATSDADSAEAGIIACGIGPCTCKGEEEIHGFVMEDYSKQASPSEWAEAAIFAYHLLMADLIVGEVNNGGEMVGYTVYTVDPHVNYKAVHASKGKYTRAEPISAMYEKGNVHHVGSFPILEDQLCTWLPGEKSPDRLDSLVWAFTELFYEPEEDGPDEVIVYDERVEISPY